MEKPGESIQTVGIIGGGRIGLELFSLFNNCRLTKVEYVVDKNKDAPAMLAAKQAKIPTYDDLDQALAIDTDFLLEVTGSNKVAELLASKIGNACGRLITHQMAFVILSVINENNSKTRDTVVNEVGHIKVEIDNELDSVGNLVNDIDGMTSEMRMLSLNARIEAARVGELGRGFAVVAQEMGNTANSVRDISKQIENLKDAIKTTSNQIETSLARLK